MFKTDLVIFDLEYGDTHISDTRHGMPSILEIGCVRVNKKGEVAGKLQVLVKPMYPEDFTPRIQQLTTITPEEMSLHGVEWKEAYEQFCEFARRTHLASWSHVDPILLRYQVNYAGMQFRHTNRCLDLWSVLHALEESKVSDEEEEVFELHEF